MNFVRMPVRTVQVVDLEPSFWDQLLEFGGEHQEKFFVALGVLVTLALLKWVKGKIGAFWRGDNLEIRPFVKNLLEILENKKNWGLSIFNGAITSKDNLYIVRTEDCHNLVEYKAGNVSTTTLSGDFNIKERLLVISAAQITYDYQRNVVLANQLKESVNV